MNGTALVYPFDGLTTREQVVLLYQLVMTVYFCPNLPRLPASWRAHSSFFILSQSGERPER
jgi:hypothetical protein